ncbi:villidin, putative, partial [Entamoeba invadens IP1]
MGDTQSTAPAVVDTTKTTLSLNGQLLPEVPSLSRFPNLEYLDLSKNTISQLDNVVTLLNLTKLNVNCNDIQNLPDLLFINLTRLQSLESATNQISVLSPLICFLTSLVNLNMEHNLLETIPDTLASCQQLTYLNLGFNKLVNIPPTIQEMPQLKGLVLNNNKITRIPKNIGKLTNLTLLNLAENEMKELPDYTMTCTNLVKLYLDNNDLQKVSPQISQLIQLKELNLRSNCLQKLPIDLTKLSNLVMCDIGDNQFNDKFYSTEPSIPQLFQRISKFSFSAPSRKVASKADRRKQSIQIQMSLSQNAKTKVFNADDIYKKEILLRISENEDFTYCRMVQCSSEMVNHSDAYIYFDMKKIVVWFGAKCNDFKKEKARNIGEILAQEKNSVIDEIDCTTKNTKDVFKSIFKVNEFSDTVYNDEEVFTQYINSLKVYTFEDFEKGVDVNEVKDEVLTSEILQSSRSVLIDTGVDVFVWAGQYSNNNEKNSAMLQAESLLSSSGRRKEQLVYVIEGNEFVIFKEYFHDLAVKDENFIETDIVEALRSTSPVGIRTSQIRKQRSPSPMRTGSESPKTANIKGMHMKKKSEDVQNGVALNTLTNKEDIETLKQLPSPRAEITQYKNELTVTEVGGQEITRKDKPLPKPPKEEIKKEQPQKVDKPVEVEPIKKQPAEKRVETPKECEKKEKSVVTENKGTTYIVPAPKQEPKTNEIPKKVETQVIPISEEKKTPVEMKKEIPNKPLPQPKLKETTNKQIAIPIEKPIPKSNKEVENEDNQLIKMAHRKTMQKKRTAATKTQAEVQRGLNAKTETEENTTPTVAGVPAQKKGVTIDEIFKQREKFVARRVENEANNVETESVQEVNPINLKRLFQVKGQRRPYVKQVECSLKSLNSGDAFVLDPGKNSGVIYQWNGKKCNRMEKGKAMDVAKRIKDKERVGSKQVVVDEGKETEQFWTALGEQGEVKLDDGVVDTVVEVSYAQSVSLLWVKYDVMGDSVTMDKVVDARNRLTKSLLEMTQCYILDTETEMFLWLGN